jgi:protein involved in polysaccharide export with SLBB domain
MKRAFTRLTIGFILIFAICVAAFAQEKEAYRLRRDDVVRIQIYNEGQVNAEIPVGKDGNLTAPFLEPMQVEGMTVAEVQKALAKAYTAKLRLRDPKVSVIITRYGTVRASVGGFVNRPGVYDLRPGDGLLTLLNYGGGPITDRADLRRATLRKANSNELIPIDLFAIYMRADTTQNYEIEDGDTLNVPESNNKVLVIGQVPRPNAYFYKEPMTVQDALAQAGGEIPTRSWLSRVLVIRERPGMPGVYDRIQVDIVRFIRNGDSAQNILLQPGDIVYVPETKTPDLDRIGRILSSAAFFGDVFRRGIFGFRL